jgi:glucose/arabinose dehydrogenase
LIRSRKCLTPEPRALERAFYAVVDRDRDSKADEVLTVARGLRMPNGVAVRDGALYVAEVSRILRFDGPRRSPSKPSRRAG